MEAFTGTKFRPIGSHIVYDDYGNAKEKTDFVPTKAYMNYLEQKRQKEHDQEIFALRTKLENQYKTYGEVDPVDFDYFLYLTQAR